MIPLTGSTEIRELVFPIMDVPEKDQPAKLIGTGFFIGKRGFAVTAAHVIDQMDPEIAYAGFVDKNTYGFIGEKINFFEKHPTEDVALIHLPNRPQESSFRISSTKEIASCDYNIWGYPMEVAQELLKNPISPDAPKYERPDLIYSKGHVRRLISRELPFHIYRGSYFYELSAIAGDGCSGGPMVSLRNIKPPIDNVVGVYIGAQNKDGLAVRTERIASWVPELLGRSLREET